ncbi:MAG TPA: hypothetical protein VI997_10240 [Candidatus Thermoplasmatota archaeon]|nr:hypothetical protein [Candidatus Thermoplasmatota archaeon]
MRILVAIAVALAGCFTPTTPVDTGTPPGPPVTTGPVHIVDDLTDCHEGDIIVFLDYAAAKRHLPAGFEPGDAQPLLNTPVPVGKAALLANSVTCGSSTAEGGAFREAQVAVSVLPPDVPGEREPAIDFYEFVHYVPEGSTLLDEMRAVGWNVVAASIEGSTTPSPLGGASGSGAVSDGEGEVYSFTFNAPAPDPTHPKLTGIGRFWHTNANGTGHVDYKIDAVSAGGAGTCTIRAGSEFATVAGKTACGPADAGATFPDFDIAFSFHFYPAVFPAGHDDHAGTRSAPALLGLGE